MKKPSDKALKRKCDALTSRKVRARGKCERCGTPDYAKLQCAHIISRTYKSLRFNELNLLCLCSGCHMKWHHDGIDAGRWLEEKFPGRYDELLKLRQTYTRINYQDIYDTLCQESNN